MKPPITRSLLALAALLGAALPLPARADAWFRVEVNAAASALDGSSQNVFPAVSDTGLVAIGAVPASLSNSQPASAAVGTAIGDGFASGQAQLTAPGSFAGAVLRATASSLAVAPAGGPNATSGFGSGRSLVAYLDTLHATGLPPGTPITFRVRLELRGAMARAGTPSPNHVQLSFGDNGTPGAPISQLVCDDLNSACNRSDTGEMVAIVGGDHGVSIELFTQVSASANLLGPTFGSSSSEFASTSTLPPHQARLCIDVITPGTGYTLDSGGDLRCAPDPLPPVQVPALPPLALGGLAVALAAAGRRTRSGPTS